MYNKAIGVTAPTILDIIANGRIYFINVLQGQVWADVTTPWGYLESETWFQEGECRLYTTTNYVSPTGYSIIGSFIVKVTNINGVAKTANFEVLSCATTDIGYFTITHNLPTVKKPGDVIDYTINVRNDDSIVQMRYAFASSPDYFPSLRVSSQSLCDNPLPPTTYHNKKCWYDDWLTPPYDCQLRNIAPGASLTATGPIVLSAVGTMEYITLGIFIYIPNLWASGKDEWITPTSLSDGWLYQITLDSCAGKVCIPDTICVGDNRYIAVCNPADPTGPCIAGTELIPPTPDPTCNPCIDVTCNDICDGLDIWSQKCENGICVKDTLIEANSPNCPSHRIDFHIRPWSWYTPDGAVTDLITKIADIDGTITNFFADIIDYRYINTEIFRGGNEVIVRINIRQLPSASGMYAMAWPLVLLKILTLVVLVGLIIIGIGMIYDYVWYLIANPAALNPTLTNKDLTDAGNVLIKEQLNNCETVTCVDPSLTQDQKATCIKNCHDGILTPWKDYQKKIYPDADHTPLDDATLAIQTCYDTYMASTKTTTDYDTYLNCLKIERETNIDKDQDNTLKTYDPNASAGEKQKPGLGLGILLLAGAGILGLTLFSKGGESSRIVTQPVVIKEERSSIREQLSGLKEEIKKL